MSETPEKQNSQCENQQACQATARALWGFGFLLSVASVVLLIIMLSTDFLVQGDKRVMEMGPNGPITSRVSRSYGTWDICQVVHGYELPTTKTGCTSASAPNCKDIKQRIGLVQATAVIGICLTGLCVLVSFIGLIAGSTNCGMTGSGILVTVLAMFTILITWAVVGDLRFNRDLCDDKYPIIDVDSYEFGYSFVVLIVAWCLIFTHMVVQIALHMIIKKKSAQCENAEEKNEEMGATEPAANDAAAEDN